MESQETSIIQSNIEKKITRVDVSHAQTSDYTIKLQSKQSGPDTKNKYIDKWNRISNSEINSHSFDQLIYDKGDKDIQWR